MIDSVGNVVAIGDFVSYGGGGNKDCEYGLITGIVIDIVNDKNKIKVKRLDAVYSSILSTKIVQRTSYKDIGKFVRVFPSDVVKKYFEYAEHNTWFHESDVKQCANWIHQGILT